MYAYLLFVVLLASGIQAQVPFIGKCPEVQVQQNFDINRYLGTWIEIEKYFSVAEVGRKCAESVYTSTDNGTTTLLHIQMTGIITKLPFTLDAHVVHTGKPGEAKLENHYTFPIHFVAPYWVLETDYDSYAVVWSCTQLIGTNTQFAWILTRDRNYPKEILGKAYDVFDRNNLSRRVLHKGDQTNCPKYN
ncbi:hypothetical protein WA026_003026 [Henosepilachna vigintioctopunctata]|uniref:Apolipoprotein D n=1 Tax=Henosepilachna vigintioctopunctata TaxID=420089 RepID=A0AAW1TIV4_9CUCU